MGNVIKSELQRRHTAFVDYYCGIHKFNGTQSAIAAGYELSSSRVTACHLLTMPHIQTMIEERLRRWRAQNDDIVQDMIAELQKIAFSRLSNVVNVRKGTNNITLLDTITDDVMPSIKKIKKNKEGGLDIEMHDKLKALELLGKMLGIFTENRRDVDEKYETMIERLAREHNIGPVIDAAPVVNTDPEPVING